MKCVPLWKVFGPDHKAQSGHLTALLFDSFGNLCDGRSFFGRTGNNKSEVMIRWQKKV